MLFIRMWHVLGKAAGAAGAAVKTPGLEIVCTDWFS
jgi:hypothetical protein